MNRKDKIKGVNETYILQSAHLRLFNDLLMLLA